ncbi:AbrB/MazE/SpoVT family DNA-binding domain-containing protein [Bacillus sp. 1P06AnD]|uniref:AbrB/MazE/SpoVT family DNA-binding domain-containing protein n=1 Tax=Bacillus sp. 1P06AnD TaxID=3132208 RepID=UPI0039A0B49C
MHKRRVTREGRVNIPAELLAAFRIKENDYVEVSHNTQSIIIKPFKDKQYCAITGKLARKGQMIGDVFVSEEGIKLIKDLKEES